MNKKTDVKRQIIILSGIIVTMLIVAIFVNMNENKKDIANTKINEILINNKEIMVDGINEQQLDNMKGLMESNTYDEYKNYFENGGSNANETVLNTTTAENLMKEGESIDYLTKEEQEDLEQDLKEALELYGDDSILE